jgi:hypothetical protein
VGILHNDNFDSHGVRHTSFLHEESCPLKAPVGNRSVRVLAAGWQPSLTGSVLAETILPELFLKPRFTATAFENTRINLTTPFDVSMLLES